MGKLLLAVIGLILLLLGGMLAIDGCSSSETQKQPPEPDVTTETIVARLREIQELASLRVAASGIVHGTQPGRRFYHGTSRMVLLVKGEAIYSVDLKDIAIDLSATHVAITLPAPEVTAAWVDVERSRVWTRERGRFREDFSERLERECWEAAHRLVREAAQKQQHRQTAALNVESVISRVVNEIDPAMRLTVQWRKTNTDA